MPDLTVSELARRYGVARSTVSRALARNTPGQPTPPVPVNPGEPQLRYATAETDLWWPRRKTAPGPAARAPAAR